MTQVFKETIDILSTKFQQGLVEDDIILKTFKTIKRTLFLKLTIKGHLMMRMIRLALLLSIVLIYTYHIAISLWL